MGRRMRSQVAVPDLSVGGLGDAVDKRQSLGAASAHKRASAARASQGRIGKKQSFHGVAPESAHVSAAAQAAKGVDRRKTLFGQVPGFAPSRDGARTSGALPARTQERASVS